MIILSLPPQNLDPTDWKDFRFGLGQYGLSIIRILEETTTHVKVEINTSSKEQEETVIDLMQLCFSKCSSA